MFSAESSSFAETPRIRVTSADFSLRSFPGSAIAERTLSISIDSSESNMFPALYKTEGILLLESRSLIIPACLFVLTRTAMSPELTGLSICEVILAISPDTALAINITASVLLTGLLTGFSPFLPFPAKAKSEAKTGASFDLTYQSFNKSSCLLSPASMCPAGSALSKIILSKTKGNLTLENIVFTALINPGFERQFSKSVYL